MPTAAGPFKPEVLTDEQVRSEAMLKNLDRLAWLMDRAIPIPGTNLRVGLDAILGLIPGAGDMASNVIQTLLVLVALKHYQVPKVVAARMVANVLLDLGVGSIPVVGDAFDAVFKANTRNVKLLADLRKQAGAGGATPAGTSTGFLVVVGLVLFGAIALMFVGLVAVGYMIVKALSH